MNTEADREIAVVDDDILIRELLQDILTDHGYEVVALASSDAFLDGLAAGMNPCCVLCDVRLPEMNGLDLLRIVGQRKPGLAMIMVTGFADVDLAVEAMKRGAADFIEKPFKAGQIMAAVEGALRRQASRDDEGSNIELLERWVSLTPRERDIAMRIAEGGTNKTVARDLGLSPRTVEVHRARIMYKMKAKSLADLVRDWIAIEGHQMPVSTVSH